MDPPFPLSVIIVTFNSSAYLSDCLESVFAQRTSAAPEVIAVDNASTDNTLDIVRERFPRVCTLRNSANEGFAAGNNRGIRRAAGSLFLLLNPDTKLHPGALAAMMKFMEEHPEAA